MNKNRVSSPQGGSDAPADRRTDGGDGGQFAVFMRLSLVLTGVKELEQDTANQYFVRVRNHLAPGRLEALLDHFDALVAKGRDPANAVAEDIMPSPEFGESAKLVLKLWYVGGIQNAAGDWEFGSADHYARALVWEAVGAHAPGFSNGYYGHWKYPPEG